MSLMLFPVLVLQDGGQKCIPSDDFECEEVRRWNYTPLCSDTNQRDLVSFWRSCLHSYKLCFCVLSCSLVSFFSHQPFGLSDINKVKNQMRSTAHQVPKKHPIYHLSKVCLLRHKHEERKEFYNLAKHDVKYFPWLHQSTTGCGYFST